MSHRSKDGNFIVTSGHVEEGRLSDSPVHKIVQARLPSYSVKGFVPKQILKPALHDRCVEQYSLKSAWITFAELTRLFPPSKSQVIKSTGACYILLMPGTFCTPIGTTSGEDYQEPAFYSVQ